INAYFIGKIFYPDSFKDIDIQKNCSKIMKDFVGKDVCDRFMDNKNFYKKVFFKNGKFEYI
ncbi:MAG: iron ABC transporter substrate-binding protein, partial [Elusimicrobiota bacterium]